MNPLDPLRPSGLDRVILGMVWLLALAGAFVYPPGSDVSPYAYSQSSGSSAIHVLGRTSLAWVSILLLVMSAGAAFVRQREVPPGLLLPLAGTGAFLLVRGAGALAQGDGEVDSVARLLLPFVLFLALYTSRDMLAKRSTTLLVLVNLTVLSQALVSKLLTGQFASNRYYIELPEEYFGYYYHPFAFSGALALCALFAVDRALAGDRRVFWTVLAGTNLIFVWNTQVRTYMVAALLGISILIARRLFSSGRIYTLGCFISACVGAMILLGPGLVSSDRDISDPSSGRLDRWVADISAFVSRSSDLEVFTGWGPGAIYRLNGDLFGVSINSLNLAVDTLVDFGVIGLGLVVWAWIAMLRTTRNRPSTPIGAGLAGFFVIASSVTSIIEYPVVVAIFVMLACRSSIDAPALLEWKREPALARP